MKKVITIVLCVISLPLLCADNQAQPHIIAMPPLSPRHHAVAMPPVAHKLLQAATICDECSSCCSRYWRPTGLVYLYIAYVFFA